MHCWLCHGQCFQFVRLNLQWLTRSGTFIRFLAGPVRTVHQYESCLSQREHATPRASHLSHYSCSALRYGAGAYEEQVLLSRLSVI